MESLRNMPEFKVITKKDCYFCGKLTQWLDDQGIEYKEIDYLNPEDPNDPVLQNDAFNSIYCDMSACVESIPVVVKDDDEIYYGALWDLKNNELNEEKAKEIFEV